MPNSLDMEKDGEGASNASQREQQQSCTKYFDQLWFCYSPVHQLKRYYVHGDVDDCVAHWGTLMACLKQKTRFRLEDVDEALPSPPCMWTLRSPEEAGAFWADEFREDNNAGHGADTGEV